MFEDGFCTISFLVAVAFFGRERCRKCMHDVISYFRYFCCYLTFPGLFILSNFFNAVMTVWCSMSNRRIAGLNPDWYTKNVGGGSSSAEFPYVLIHGWGALEQGTWRSQGALRLSSALGIPVCMCSPAPGWFKSREWISPKKGQWRIIYLNLFPSQYTWERASKREPLIPNKPAKDSYL